MQQKQVFQYKCITESRWKCKSHKTQERDGQEPGISILKPDDFWGTPFPFSLVSLLGRNLPVTGDNDKVASKPVGNELMALEGKAGSTFIRLVKVDTLIPSHNELQVLRRITQS
jgi:hypothetical protein